MARQTQRLDRFLADACQLTRAEARRLVLQHRILINQQPCANASAQVAATDQVCLDGQLLTAGDTRAYVLLNKPVGYETSRVSQHHPVVYDLLQDLQLRVPVQAVGRLDVDTSGLLLLTNDGQWAHRILSPRHVIAKVYRAWLAEPLCDDAENQLQQGLLLRGESKRTLPASLVRHGATEVSLTLTEGRYHQVRRMFAALNNRVVALQREAIGCLRLDEQLPSGAWRLLTPEEVCSFESADS